VLEAIVKESVNTITLVGDAMARPFAEQVKKGDYDTSSLMVIVSAGAILSDSVKNEMQELVPEAMILNNFGATETGHQGASFENSATGRPTFAMHDGNVVIDEDHNPIERGSDKIGFLARKGRLPIGYYKDPVKTAKTFFEINGERWVVTGDMAMVEEDGLITIQGRGAVCINTGGEKVFPEEVEESLKAHPAVMDAVVVGVPDEKWGQRVAAVIQPREGMSVDREDLLRFCRTKVAGYKVPREYFSVETVLRHPSGKPDYRWAKDIATGALEA
jgi:acyl-CoA synthetase (AMP-forming)/AMP-acid ligase II